MEGFSNLDSTDFNYDRESLEKAINFAIGENDAKLAKCGYNIYPIHTYFDSSDLIAAKNEAKKLEEQGVWLIQGPQHSDAFVMASRGLNNTGLVSTMAVSESAMTLNPPFFSMSTTSDEFARLAVMEIKKRKFGLSYATFVDATCSACISYEKSFNKYALLSNYKKIFNLDYANERPILEELKNTIEKNKIEFLLLPNYSKSVAYTISYLHRYFPKLKYIGFAGWGQGFWSFITFYSIPDYVEAISIRQGLNYEDMRSFFGIYSLGRKLNGIDMNPSMLDYLTIEFVRHLTQDLCEIKPNTKEDFIKYLSSLSKDHYRTKLPISVFKLKNKSIGFDNIISLKSNAT